MTGLWQSQNPFAFFRKSKPVKQKKRRERALFNHLAYASFQIESSIQLCNAAFGLAPAMFETT